MDKGSRFCAQLALGLEVLHCWRLKLMRVRSFAIQNRILNGFQNHHKKYTFCAHSEHFWFRRAEEHFVELLLLGFEVFASGEH